jgi:hypothetical protein
LLQVEGKIRERTAFDGKLFECIDKALPIDDFVQLIGYSGEVPKRKGKKEKKQVSAKELMTGTVLDGFIEASQVKPITEFYNQFYVIIWDNKTNDEAFMLSQFAPSGSIGRFQTIEEAREASAKLKAWLRQTKRKPERFEARIEKLDKITGERIEFVG